MTTAATRQTSSSHEVGMPCAENSNSQPRSPVFQNALSSPTSSYAPSRPASVSSGSDSCTSTPLTPQSPFSAFQDVGGKETISPDTILQHYMHVARRLTENRQSCAASPCPSIMSINASPREVEAILAGDPAPTQAQAPPAASQPTALDWPPPWALTGGLTLDELPDSDLWTLPEYQLTQEWLDQTVRELKELEEKRVKEEGREIEVDVGDDIDVDVEMEVVGVGPRG